MTKAIQFADIYLMALPTKAMREVATQINDKLTSKKTFILKVLKMGRLNVCEMIEDSISRI